MSDFFSERISHVPLKTPYLPVRYLPPQKDPAHPEKKYHPANGLTAIHGEDLWSNDVSKREPPQVTTTCQQCQKYYSEVWCDDHERYLCTWCNRELHASIGYRNHLRKPLYDSSTQERWKGDIADDLPQEEEEEEEEERHNDVQL